MRNASGARNTESDGTSGWSDQLRELKFGCLGSINLIGTYLNHAICAVDFACVCITNYEVGSCQIPCCNRNAVGTNESEETSSCLMNRLKGSLLLVPEGANCGHTDHNPLDDVLHQVANHSCIFELCVAPVL